MHKRTAVVVSIVGLALALASPAEAQKKGTLSSKGSEGRGSATSDDNIKTAAGANDKAKVIPAPPKKGGKVTRGDYGSCPLYVDNRTGLWVNLYTDGAYRGQVSPYGNVIGYVGCGSTSFYARADYTDGSYRYWGPSRGYVSGSFYWTIWP